MVYDSIIFDLDGTLWDVAEPCAAGWRRALAALGLDARVSAADIRRVAGLPFPDCVATLLGELDGQGLADLTRAIDREEKALLKAEGGMLYPGVQEGIPRLAEQHRLAVVSNCQGWYLQLFLDESGLSRYFQAWDCHGDSGLSKAEMIRRMVDGRSLGCSVYVGDTEGDRKAAAAAQLDFAYAAYGFGEASAYDFRLDSFSALMSRLARA